VAAPQDPSAKSQPREAVLRSWQPQPRAPRPGDRRAHSPGLLRMGRGDPSVQPTGEARRHLRPDLLEGARSWWQQLHACLEKLWRAA
jgi:hypothetical protein